MYVCLSRNRSRVTAFAMLVVILAVAVCVSNFCAPHLYGLEKRVPWTTSRFKGTPDPPSPYRTEVVLPQLKLDEPVDITFARGTDRLFVVQRFGKFFTLKMDAGTETADLMLEAGEASYGLAVHPNFPEQPYVYVTYVTDKVAELPKGTRVSRFHVTEFDPPVCDPASEQILLEWPSGGHNGGCLKFGPDGCLYVATGDSSGIADEYLTGQDLGSLAGSILRIDVDHPDDGKPYGIRADNPFVGVEGARSEIWAYGLRQPWKMSFHEATGHLWAGNIGQDLWEQIYRIDRGGNYGWSITEGGHPFRPERPRGPTPILQPIVEHSHTEFRSITGGFVYRGSRLSELAGAYIYGDYDTGKIWAFRYDDGQVTDHHELVDSNIRVICFAEDGDGELVFVDHVTGQLHRLVPNTAQDASSDFPRKLSQTGLFTSVADHLPAPGVVPYSINAPMWMDGARAERFLAIPGVFQVEFDGTVYPQPAPGAPHGWKFPDGTVVIQTISLETEKGNPTSRKRLETRILHHERLQGSSEMGDQIWHGYCYVWNDDQTDATLLEDPGGLDRPYTITDSDARQQTWHFPSRAECSVCHNIASKYVIGINTRQMNKEHDYKGGIVNQLTAWEHAGLFTESLPAPPDELPRLADYRDETHDLTRRARSYLHANCGHCHRKWGGGNASFRLYSNLNIGEMGIVGVRPEHGTFFVPDARILAPGDPQRSVLFFRLAKLGPGRMPRLGSNVVDRIGTRLIYDWIGQMPSGGEEVSEETDRLRTEANLMLAALNSGTLSEHEAGAAINRLLSSTRGAIRLARVLQDADLPIPIQARVIANATTHPALHVRDLFESYLPENQRTLRLGNVILPAQILALDGDVSQGKKVFFETAGVQCKNCHRIGEEGSQVGPDLTQIGKKYDRARILETILEPSKQIEEKYLTYQVETSQGQVHTGLLVSRDERQVVLKDAQSQLVHIAVDDIELMVTQQKSLMPELLLREMTARQVADLTEYLSSLK